MYQLTLVTKATAGLLLGASIFFNSLIAEPQKQIQDKGIEITDNIEEAFNPLKLHITKNQKDKEALDNYMYMYHQKDKFFYKHRDYRDYIVIRNNGKLIDGEIKEGVKW